MAKVHSITRLSLSLYKHIWQYLWSPSYTQKLIDGNVHKPRHTATFYVTTWSGWSRASIASLFLLLSLPVSVAILHLRHPHHIISHGTGRPDKQHRKTTWRHYQVYAAFKHNTRVKLSSQKFILLMKILKCFTYKLHLQLFGETVH